MKNLRLLAIGSLSAVVIAAGALVACSDDTTTNPTDAGGPDTSTGETSTGDGGADASDASPDVIDAGFVVQTFPQQLATEICKSLARCCYGSANIDGGAPVDGGTYDQAGCIDNYVRNGWDQSNTGTAAALDAGAIELDQAKALDCVNKITALSCNLPASEYDLINASCFAAYKGKMADGAACSTSLECGSTSFCKRPNNTTAGVCAPLRAAGDPCGDFVGAPEDFNIADEACSYRSSGIPDMHCDSFDFVTGLPKPDTTAWTCVANLSLGSSCVNTNWCAAGICKADSHQCVDPDRYFDSTCDFYVKK